MLAQNMTQVKPRSPAVTQRLLEHDLTRLNGLTIEGLNNEQWNTKCFEVPISNGFGMVCLSNSHS